jgi:hypothetical protein
MITPTEIKEQSLKWWKEVLLSTIESVPYFPKEVSRIGKVSSKDILNKLSDYKQSIELLKSNSKENKKAGYTLHTTERQFDKIGSQSVPEKITIESISDYLQVTGKEKEYQIFLKNFSIIISELPSLLEWVKANPTKMIEHETWNETLKVCKFFMATPKPKLYVRQLPIDIHTKYIFNNRGIVESLLEFLIPEHINTGETKFESRFNLKYSEHLVRIRFLDTRLSPLDNVTDISLTISEFMNFNLHCDSIFVTENLMNFLTLPSLERTIAIWSGGGFNVSHLQNIQWLRTKQFYYWGDIDAHGFQILNQFRMYFPNTISIMMDEETLSNFASAAGQKAANQNLKHLLESELELYNHLQANNIRLEQEKITHAYALNKIKIKMQKCFTVEG